MKVISPAHKFVLKLLPEVKIKESDYRLFSYVLWTELQTEDIGELDSVDASALLHNTLTGELIYLDKSEHEALTKLPASYESWMDDLITSRFIVPVDQDDKKLVDGLRTLGRTLYKTESKDIYNYVILPTTNCNARCFYCFEHCKKDFVYENMSDETADSLVEFIDKNHGTHPVHITWFGGEPLLGKNLIERISRQLEDRGIIFSSEMVTNGYLFNEEIIKIAKDKWHLDKVQITLDGTEEIYNEVKNYVNPCESPYKRVLKNIDALLGAGIKVLILLNIGLHNTDDIMMLADELVAHFPDEENLLISSQKLYETCGSAPTEYSDDEYEQLHHREMQLNKKFAVYDENLYKFLDNNKSNDGNEKSTTLPHIEFIHCMADGETGLCALPSGKFTKCMHYTTDHFVGDVYNGITSPDELNFYKEQKVFPACATCEVYPICLNLNACEKISSCRPLDAEAKKDIYHKKAIKAFKEQL